MRTALLAILLAGLLITPSALALDAPTSDDFLVSCGSGFVGDTCRAALGLACEVITFLLGPAICASIA